jgi:voltage-gated potassium channel
MNRKILIYGYSGLGARLAHTLSREKDYQVTIVSANEQCCKQAKNDGFLDIYNYDLMDDEELMQVGIHKNIYQAFFVVSDNDKNNIFVILSARSLNPNLSIISVSRTANDSDKMKLAGANKVINPYEAGGLKIFRLIHKPAISKMLDDMIFHNKNIDIFEVKVQKGCAIDGKNFRYVEKLDFDIIFLGMVDKELGNKFIFHAKGLIHKIDAGDILVILAKDKEVKRFIESISNLDKRTN